MSGGPPWLLFHLIHHARLSQSTPKLSDLALLVSLLWEIFCFYLLRLIHLAFAMDSGVLNACLHVVRQTF